jgi:hypothetical protein
LGKIVQSFKKLKAQNIDFLGKVGKKNKVMRINDQVNKLQQQSQNQFDTYDFFQLNLWVPNLIGQWNFSEK